jgi:hypothetical protein
VLRADVRVARHFALFAYIYAAMCAITTAARRRLEPFGTPKE